MFHVYNEYHYKRKTLCVALQIMADVITVDNAITLDVQEHIWGGEGGRWGGGKGARAPPSNLVGRSLTFRLDARVRLYLLTVLICVV